MREIENRIRNIRVVLASRERLPEYHVLKTEIVLPQLERAAQKAREGTRFVCDDCGDPIPEERLKAAAGATRCVKCQVLAESRQP